MPTLTIFGPNHSGKSTLGGFFVTHDLSSDEYIKRIEQMRNAIGSEYQPDRALGYFMDVEAEARRKSATAKGTSKQVHYTRLNILGLDVSILDVPGFENRSFANKATSYGEHGIGLYVVEISDLLSLYLTNRDDDEYERIHKKVFSAVEMWRNHNGLDSLIVALWVR